MFYYIEVNKIMNEAVVNPENKICENPEDLNLNEKESNELDSY